MGPGWVYFAKPDNDIARVKIGWAESPFLRLHHLSCGSSHPLVLVALFPQSKKAETFLHATFAAEHVHREWYTLSPRIVQTIRLMWAARDDGSWELRDLRALISKAEKLARTEPTPIVDRSWYLQDAKCPNCYKPSCPGEGEPGGCAQRTRLVHRGNQTYIMTLPPRKRTVSPFKE